MNLNLSIKYQLHDSKKPLLIFYLTIFLTTFSIILLTCLPKNNVISVKGSLQGIEAATAIFLLIAGMNSFKEVFRMFVQNGVSRKTMFIGRLVSVTLISMGMALVDSITASLNKKIIHASSNLEYVRLIDMLYGSRYENYSSGFLRFVEGVLLLFCIYAAFSMMGYFITALFYRMNKSTKIAVSVGVPAGLFVLLPVVDSFVFQGAIGRAIERFMLFAFGFSNGANPYYAMVTMILSFAVFSGLSWLIVRKAVMKD